MEKIVEQGMLYDFYGELLTEHQRKIYEDVVLNDMSLSEIAEEQGISRQGVHDLVRRCDRTLQSLSLIHILVGRKEKFGSSSKREARFFWKGILFASPWLIGFVCFILLPVCLAFYYSFTDYNLFNEPAWVGLKNYKDAFKDQYVWKGLKNTLYMVVISPIVGMVVSLLLALLLNQKNIPGLPFFRTVFYLPSLVSCGGKRHAVDLVIERTLWIGKSDSGSDRN